jgi:hypothetical protein
MLRGRGQLAVKAETATPEDGNTHKITLAEVLTHLLPPQQEYEVLADQARQLLEAYPEGHSVERALASYLWLFAYGYRVWQNSYTYHYIHEYFYGAFLRALHEGGPAITPQLRAFLYQFTRAMIAYTGCENAFISGDAFGLYQAATSAHEHAEAAHALLPQTNIAVEARESLRKYLEINLALYRGLEVCANVHLGTGTSIAPASEHILQESLAFLHSPESGSRELYSELRAHSVFAHRYVQAQQERESTLRINQASVILRAIGYVGEDLIERLFAAFDEAETKKGGVERFKAAAQETSGLHFAGIRKSVVQDIFETSLGVEYLDQVVFDLPCDNEPILVAVRDGQDPVEYNTDSVVVRVARFGSISVEFEFEVEGRSVSHLRALESLISPHAGRYNILWRNAPSSVQEEKIGYVEVFIAVLEWTQFLCDEAQRYGITSPALQRLQAEMRKWEDGHLAVQVPWNTGGTLSSALGDEVAPPPGDASEAEEESDDGMPEVRQGLIEHLRIVRGLAQQCLDDPTIRALPSYSDFEKTGGLLFGKGARFGYFVDLAEKVLERVSIFLASLLEKGQRPTSPYQRITEIEARTDLHRMVTFDPNTGWQAIIACHQLAFSIPASPQDTAGQHEPTQVVAIEPNDTTVMHHRDFTKGLLVQSREARASLNDWISVPVPRFRNLAGIRSHELDVMIVGENRAFLYLPDDPQFLVDQYRISASLIGDIRTIVLAFNTRVKEAIKSLDRWYKAVEDHNDAPLAQSRVQIEQQREQIEILRTRSDGILDLIRSYTISKYQDHSDLLQAMVEESGVDKYRNSLVGNLATLDRFQSHLSFLMQRKIDDRSRTNGQLIAALLFVLSLLQAISAINPIASLLSQVSFLSHDTGYIEAILFLILAALVLGGAIFLLARWRRVR